jgi:murein DD-endopeptidase MepM/ murein hydrolase activator NlpD
MSRWLPLCLLVLVGLDALARAAPDEATEDDPFSPKPLAQKGPAPPWPRRKRATEKIKPSAHGLVDLSRWPAEPASPTGIEPERFAGALKELCGGWWPPKRPLQWAGWMLEHSRTFKVDPFLVAAVIYRQSRCLTNSPEVREESFGIGMAQIDPRMHSGFLRKGHYRYFVLEKGHWEKRELEMDRFSLGNLRRAEPSIYFTAALLAMAREQCPAIDAAFGSVPHRHYLSHFIWGDRVRGAGPEDRVLNARRRIIEYYKGAKLEPRGKHGELALRCPLDGAPRIVSSVMGADRQDGKRVHKGIDFASTWGEPVRAVAAGRIVLAGLDRLAGGPINVPPEEATKIKPSEMGPGGLFVMLLHDGGLRSAYMHLSSYEVKANDKVTVGQLIGYVGKTGTKESGAHLHFELREAGKHVDPMPAMAPYVIHPDQTWLGLKLGAEEKRVRKVRRIAKWRATHPEAAETKKERRGGGASGEGRSGATKGGAPPAAATNKQ